MDNEFTPQRLAEAFADALDLSFGTSELKLENPDVPLYVVTSLYPLGGFADKTDITAIATTAATTKAGFFMAQLY